uniref:Uncharacterized protein n=1 Tax=Rhizophora mucronata TaxID=61149 RepID=A0A2P2KZ12_RHIMU
MRSSRRYRRGLSPLANLECCYPIHYPHGWGFTSSRKPGATVSISVTHVHIGPSSDSASVPTSGSRSPRSGGLSHGNLKCFNKKKWCWFTSVISWLCNFHFQPDTQQ